LLYAGTTSLLNCKYSNYIFSVKKLQQRSKSAGNQQVLYNTLVGTSETLRNGIITNIENVKSISNHVPKHQKPINDNQLGHYLAGLIDGDGHFSNIPQLVIVFSHPDAFLAYSLKELLGFGNVRKLKDKNAYIYVVSNKAGIMRVIDLINNKLRTKHKFDQVINNVINNDAYKDLNSSFVMNSSDDFNNH
jgi:hypothetical protein